MKKIGIFAFTLFLACSAFSQEGKTALTPQEKADKLTANMTTALVLTPEQTETISSINSGIAQKNEGIRSNTSLTTEQKKEIIASNRSARISMYQGVLTADQFAKFEELEKKKSERVIAKNISGDDEL